MTASARDDGAAAPGKARHFERPVKTKLAALLVPSLFLAAAVYAEDWAKIAVETDEPAFAMQIETVTPGSPAETIGLQPGDFIYQIGEHAMRGFVARNRSVEEMLFFCRSGKKGTAAVKAGKIGVSFVEVFRPQLAYLRGEIGKTDPRWDATVTESLALLPIDPAASLHKWEEAAALEYPRDELDTFVRNLTAWRLGRAFSARQTYDAVVAEFKTMPRLYAAHLEDMAYATGQLDLLKALRLMDPDSSTVSLNLLKTWETMAAAPTPERGLLDLARQRRGRDLLPELEILQEDQPPGAEERLVRLKTKGKFEAPPGRILTTRVRLPEDAKDFHVSLLYQLYAVDYEEGSVSRARLGLYGGRNGKRLSQPVLAELTVSANPDQDTRLSARGGYDAALHHGRLNKPIPFKIQAEAEEEPQMSGVFRIDLIRLGGEAAAYCDGVPYCHLPIDPAVENYELQWLVSGISSKIVGFEAWTLKSG